jgi:hypothetical protein
MLTASSQPHPGDCDAALSTGLRRIKEQSVRIAPQHASGCVQSHAAAFVSSLAVVKWV